MLLNIKNKIISFIDFFKKRIGLNFAVFSLLSLTFFEIVQYKTYMFLYLIPFCIIATFIYIAILYFFLNSEKACFLFNYQKIYSFYKMQYGRKYLIKQFKDIIIEEFLLRYLPLVFFINLVSLNNHKTFLFIVLITFLFTVIHKFEHLILQFEFFIFFLSLLFLFKYTNSFIVLFLPHLIRNLLIQYLLKNKKYD